MTNYGYSKIQDFESCPHKYYFRWELGLRPKRVNPNLFAGTLIHAARHKWLESGKQKDAGIEAIAAAFTDIEGSLQDDPTEFINYCIRMFTEYAERWKDEKVERTGYEVDFETNIGDYPFTGRLDGVVVVDGMVFVDEVKTTGVPPQQFIQEMHMDGKTTGYVWAAQKLTGKTVAGVYLDIIYKKRDKAKTFDFVRDITLRSEDQLTQWERATIDKLDHIKGCRETGYWPHHYGHCHGRYGKCPYLDLCKYGERKELIDAQFTLVEQETEENGSE
jgi:hypothetical protein